MANDIVDQLSGGDRRSIGRSAEVVADVLANPGLFGQLVEGMLHADPLVRMRAADAAEKVTAAHPEYLDSYKDRLIHEIARVPQQEVRWHAAQMLSRLELDPPEQNQIVEILYTYLDDPSRIVKTFAMQALADIALQNLAMRPEITARIEELTRTGSPAMQSRGKKLLYRLRQAEIR